MDCSSPDINLYHLYIQLPVGFDKKTGKPVAYIDKSIGAILDDQEFYDLLILEEWFAKQFLNYINWNIKKPITAQIVAKALETFYNLGIQPKECRYIEDGKESK